MNKKSLIVGITILLITVELSGCTEEAKDTDGDGYNDDADAFPDDPDEWKDSDNDGVGDNGDVFPYGSTQWADRDGDGYGDNLNGKDPDAFPDDPNEWRDSDSDGIGDNADILDDGDGGIKVAITKYEGDYYSDDFGETDPYFKIYIYTYNYGTEQWDTIDSIESKVYDETNIVYDPVSLIVDVDDDIPLIGVSIMAYDYDLWSNNDEIDLNEESADKSLFIYFYPQQTSYQTYTSDGRADLLDEMDGYIEYSIRVVEV